MKLLAFVLLTWLAALSTASAVSLNADPSERNYRVIIDRNPFGLKPPPPPPTNTAALTPQTKDEILLTGITAMGSVKAYFMSAKPAKDKKEPEYYTLGVDEKKNGLEVLSIDPVAKSVRVRNAGIESVMTFAANGVKAPPSPGAPAPGTPGSGNVAMGLPGTPPTPSAAVPPPVALPGATVSGATFPGVPGVSTPGTGRVRTIPSRNVRTPPASINPGIDPNLQANRPNPDAAVQDIILMEAQRAANPHVEFPPTPFPQ